MNVNITNGADPPGFTGTRVYRLLEVNLQLQSHTDVLQFLEKTFSTDCSSDLRPK